MDSPTTSLEPGQQAGRQGRREGEASAVGNYRAGERKAGQGPPSHPHPGERGCSFPPREEHSFPGGTEALSKRSRATDHGGWVQGRVGGRAGGRRGGKAPDSAGPGVPSSCFQPRPRPSSPPQHRLLGGLGRVQAKLIKPPWVGAPGRRGRAGPRPRAAEEGRGGRAVITGGEARSRHRARGSWRGHREAWLALFLAW